MISPHSSTVGNIHKHWYHIAIASIFQWSAQRNIVYRRSYTFHVWVSATHLLPSYRRQVSYPFRQSVCILHVWMQICFWSLYRYSNVSKGIDSIFHFQNHSGRADHTPWCNTRSSYMCEKPPGLDSKKENICFGCTCYTQPNLIAVYVTVIAYHSPFLQVCALGMSQVKSWIVADT